MRPITPIKLLAIVLISMNLANASPAAPQNGLDYHSIEKSAALKNESKATVVEFFAYFCPHCYALELPLQVWAQQNKANVQFRRVHLSFGNKFAAQQRLYYALEVMGKIHEFHQRIFDEIHVNGKSLNDDKSIIQFMVKQGIEEKTFRDVYFSSRVNSEIARANELQNELKVEGVPVLLVGGRYLTSPALFHKKLNFFDAVYLSAKSRLGIDKEKDKMESKENSAAIQVVDFLVKNKKFSSD